MQTDLEKYLKGAAALGTPRELGEYIARELPPSPDDAQPLQAAAGTQRQAQKQRTEVQMSARPPTPTPMKVPLELMTPTPTTPPQQQPMALVDSAEIPTTPDGDSGVPEMPSDMHLADEPPTNERLLPEARGGKHGRGSSSHTAVVPPLPHSPLRTYLAAIIAALTVGAVTLLALRPWAAAKDPVIVEVPAAPPAIVVEKPTPVEIPLEAPVVVGADRAGADARHPVAAAGRAGDRRRRGAAHDDADPRRDVRVRDAQGDRGEARLRGARAGGAPRRRRASYARRRAAAGGARGSRARRRRRRRAR